MMQIKTDNLHCADGAKTRVHKQRLSQHLRRRINRINTNDMPLPDAQIMRAWTTPN